MAVQSNPASEPDAAQLEEGRILFAGVCDFVMSVTRIDDLPAPFGTEIAFAGRSNVGKSSLLNALTGRTSLARTSVTPGRTQALNFFRLADALTLVDLPGYGFAKAGKADIRAWSRLHNAYLRGRPNLRRVLILIDARHGIKPLDEATMEGLDGAAVSYQAVLTKVDKISALERAVRLKEVQSALRRHVAAHPEVIATSAHEGTGIAELRAALAALSSA
jgi:GTP-binding protein